MTFEEAKYELIGLIKIPTSEANREYCERKNQAIDYAIDRLEEGFLANKRLTTVIDLLKDSARAEVLQEFETDGFLCPKCETRGVVIDSRLYECTNGKQSNRRRRECPNCGTRWTTKEIVVRSDDEGSTV